MFTNKKLGLNANEREIELEKANRFIDSNNYEDLLINLERLAQRHMIIC